MDTLDNAYRVKESDLNNRIRKLNFELDSVNKMITQKRSDLEALAKKEEGLLERRNNLEHEINEGLQKIDAYKDAIDQHKQTCEKGLQEQSESLKEREEVIIKKENEIKTASASLLENQGFLETKKAEIIKKLSKITETIEKVIAGI